MTNDPHAAVQTPSPYEVERRFDQTGAVLFLISVVLGVLRAVGIVATGTGGFAPWLEASYSAVFHVGVGVLASATVRAAGVWLGRESARGGGPIHVAPPITMEEPSATVEAPGAPPEPSPPRDPARWRAQLDAAREAGDPTGVLDLREEAPEGLEEELLKALDADLAKWLLMLVHQRLRSGPLQLDLVTLVARGSDALAHTKEGASLRAALPTLRRGAGLCPRCAKPYTGVWEACAECMGRPEPPPPVIPGLMAVDDEGYEPPAAEEQWFLDPDDALGPDRRNGA